MISASTLRKVSQSARAALDAEKQQQHNINAAAAERRAEELTDYIISLLPSEEEAIARATGDWTLPNGRKARPAHGVGLLAVRPPTKHRDTGEHMYPSEEVYFSSYNKETGELGPTGPGSGGVPMVMLLQGRKPVGASKPDPTDAPGGKNVLMRLTERLNAQADDPADALQVRTIYTSKKGLQVCVTWDPEAWDQQQLERRESLRRDRQPDRRQGRGRRHETEPRSYNSVPPPSDGQTVSFDDWERQQKERVHVTRTQRPRTPPANPGAAIMEKMGYKEGDGLGRDGQGRREPVEAKSRRRGHGIGYETKSDSTSAAAPAAE